MRVDKNVRALRSVQTPQQLAELVESLSKNKNIKFTDALRDALLLKQHFMAGDDAVARAYCDFLLNFATDESTRPQVCTKEIAVMITSMIGPSINSNAGCYRAAKLLTKLCLLDPAIFLNRTSADILIDLSLYAKSNNTAFYVACAINNMMPANDVDARLYFTSEKAVAAFEHLMTLPNNDEDCVRVICKVIGRILNDNDRALRLFGTPQFVKVYETMKPKLKDNKNAISTYDATLAKLADEAPIRGLFLAKTPAELAAALPSLHDDKFHTERVRDLLILKQYLMVTEEAVDATARFLVVFILHLTKKGKAGTELAVSREVYILLVSMLLPMTTSHSAFNVFLAVCNFNNGTGTKLFATAEATDALLRAFHETKTQGTARWAPQTVVNILNQAPEAIKFYLKPETVEAFEAIMQRVSNDDGAKACSRALKAILDTGKEAQELFSSQTVLTAFIGFGKHAKVKATLDYYNYVLNILQKNVQSDGDAPVMDSMPSVKRSFAKYDKAGTVPSFDDAVKSLLSINYAPANRPDLKSFIPKSSDIDNVIERAEDYLPTLKERASIKTLVQKYKLTDDDIKAIFCYKAEHPYPVYRWLNGWLNGANEGRGNDTVQKHVAPFYTLLYRALEKLPKVTKRAARSAIVRNIPALRDIFDHYEKRCAEGKMLNFWSFSSFSGSDSVINAPHFCGGPHDDGIMYSCGSLTGVDLEAFKPAGMPDEAEIMPMSPCVFKIQNAMKHGNKLIIGIKQMPHEQYAYIEPRP